MKQRTLFCGSLVAVLSVSFSAQLAAQAVPAKSPGYEILDKDLRSFGAIDLTRVIELKEDTTWNATSLSLPDGTIIFTNGHKLDIDVRSLVIGGQVLIRSFQAGVGGGGARPDKPEKTGGGNSFDRGPNQGSGTAAEAQGGAAGGSGGNGISGKAGAPGRSAASIRIKVTGAARGTLIVDNFGTRGGPGGDGGDAGDGGNGQQGGRGQSGDQVAGATIGCKSGAGWGGAGGRGGDGGSGGKGGVGGAGADVVIDISDARFVDLILISAAGAWGGQEGWPGTEGGGGLPGYGGRGNTGCDGEEYRRMGQPGTRGTPGQISSSADGPSGCIRVPEPLRKKLNYKVDARNCVIPRIVTQTRPNTGQVQNAQRKPARVVLSGDELYLLWEKISGFVTGVSTKKLILPAPRSGVTAVMTFSAPPLAGTFFSAIQKYVAAYTLAPAPREPSCDLNALIGRMLAAYTQKNTTSRLNSHLDCVERISLSGATTYRDLAKFVFLAATIDLLSHEIARNSVSFPNQTAFELAAEPDRVYLLWPPATPSDPLIYTDVDHNLMARIVLIMDALQDKLFSALSEQNIGTNALLCGDTARAQLLDWAQIPTYFFSFSVSTGDPVDVWTTEGTKNTRSVSMRFKSSPYRTFIGTIPSSSSDFSWTPTPVVTYTEFLSGRSDSNAFPCLGDAGMVQRFLSDPNSINLLNNMPAAMMFFGSIYLDSVFKAGNFGDVTFTP
jgi:hypothetical protein